MRLRERCDRPDCLGRMKCESTKRRGPWRIRYLKCDSCDRRGKETVRLDADGNAILAGKNYDVDCPCCGGRIPV